MKIHPETNASYFGPNLEPLQLQKRRCNLIVPDKKNPENCCCLYPISKHDDDIKDKRFKTKNNENDLKWTKEDCTEDCGNTDAYGKINFSGTDTKANYVRLSYETDVKKLLELLFNNEKYWYLKEPKLIISVTGAAEKISLDPKLKDSFSDGLVKAAVTTNALVITGGTNGGCMKLVGEAFKLNKFSIDQSNKINLLGIADWCAVYNNHSLVNKEILPNFVEYDSSKPNKETGKKSVLEPNHTHFILADDAYNYFGADIELRAKLESKIAKEKKAKIVLLAIGGGPNSAKSISEAINENTPCVILESSGGMECGFSYAINRVKSLSSKEEQSELLNSDEFWDKVKQNLIKGFRDTKDPKERADKTIKHIKEALKLENLNFLTVCRSRNGRAELDEAILKALLYAKKGNENDNMEKEFETQLELALSWNRIDIARKYLFIDQNINRICSEENFTTAIIDNKYEFVELFLENGFSLKSYLTKKQLLVLYNETIKKYKSSYLYKMIEKINIKKTDKSIEQNALTFNTIGKIITRLVDDVYTHKFKKSPFNLIKKDHVEQFLQSNYEPVLINIGSEQFLWDEGFENPEHEMFMLSVLLCRFEMSMLFLYRGPNPICSALIASKINTSYDNEFADDSDECEIIAKEYITLACDILKLYYEKNELESQLTLVRRIHDFDEITCFKLATFSHNLDFVATQAFQNLLLRIWYNKILPEANKLSLSLSLCFPFLSKFVIDYRVNSNDSQEEQYSNTHPQIEKKEDLDNESLKNTEAELEQIDIDLKNEFFDRGVKGDYFYLEFLYHFLNTPFVKFIYHQIWFFFFLVLFSYVILCDFHKFNNSDEKTSLGLGISIPEIILIIWVFAYIFEEIYKFLINDMKKRFVRKILIGDLWQGINTLAIILFLIAFVLRLIENEDCFKTAKIILAFDVILWFIKFLKAYTFLRQLGPKFYMIREMLNQLAYFMLIVLVIMFAFGVSSTALMLENSELNYELIKIVFLPGYFVIGGEYFTLDDLLGASSGDCSDLEVYEKCPDETGTAIALALYVIYILILNILLVNLLIAIFDNTYKKIEKEANEIWKFQRYELVFEYYNKPFLPAPFLIINIFLSLIKFLIKLIAKCFLKNNTNLSCIKFMSRNRMLRSWTNKWNYSLVYEMNKNEENLINDFEKELANQLIRMRVEKKNENFEAKVDENYEKLNILTNKFEEFIDRGNIMFNESVKSIESKLEKLIK